MAQTYCGKDCAACAYMEDQTCAGCRQGPASQISGDCEIAKCCRTKGHADCTTCMQKDYCGQLKNSHRAPALRLQKQENEARLRATLLRRAPFFAKWLAILFWLFIPANIASILGNETVLQLFPGLQTPAFVLEILCEIVRIVVLFILSKEVSHYHTAGICCVLATIVQVCSFLFNDAVLQILLLLPAAVLAIVGLYQEYEGHIAALYGVNDVLAQKWSALWKRELTFLLLALGGGLFALLIPIIAALAVLVGAIGSFVVSIKRLIYLYQSAKTFREYIQDGAEPYALP